MALPGAGASRQRLERRFFTRDPESVALALLGQVLVRVTADGQRLSGRIVEVEAYLGEPDRACHTYNGRRTARNASMWLTGGHAYVYFTYGMHHCFNVVTGSEGDGSAVLIRALQPLEGLTFMRLGRAGRIEPERLRERDLCSGPAKLCQALSISRALDGEDLIVSEQLFVETGAPISLEKVVRAARVGVGYAQEWADRPLRFYEQDNPHVSVR